MKTKYAFALSLVAAMSVGAGALASGVQQPQTPPDGPGLTLINEKCGFCHTTAQVFVTRRSAAEWPGIVQQMIDRGAELTPAEQGTISSYLAANWSTDGAAAPATATPGAQVPPGVNAPVTAPTGAATPAATLTPATAPGRAASPAPAGTPAPAKAKPSAKKSKR